MSFLPFGELPPYRPRKFLPPVFSAGNWPDLELQLDRLTLQLPLARTPAELESWLLAWSEVSAAVDEEKARRYIAMSCHTDNPEVEKAYLHFVEDVEPKLKPVMFRLSREYLAHPARGLLNRQRFEVLDRDTELQVRIYREENVPLQTEESKLENEYGKLCGGLTVNFRGEEKTLVAMGRYQEEPDRAVREEAWRLVTARRLQEKDNFESIFDNLIDLRQRQAKNAGHANYRDFAFELRGRFDYGPSDCERFHDAIEAEVVPLMRRLHRERRDRMGLPTLRPWDTSVDPQNRPPLTPFTTTAELEERTQAIFDGLDSDLGQGFQRMRLLRLLDLANRKGKAPGGYQYTLGEARVPFIFMNAVGLQRDVETILHEAGHAFHALAAMEEDLHAYRSAPIEFCEVASMAMELLAAPGLDRFYSAPDARRARRVHLEGIVGVLPWIATIDAFQHWVYTHPGHSRDERMAAWTSLMLRFGGEVDWTGVEDVRSFLWHRQPHLFQNPFYYIEYGIAQLGALQVWNNSRHDPRAALEKYKAGLALGGSRPLPELFAAAGCRFDFTRSTLKPLVGLLESALAAESP